MSDKIDLDVRGALSSSWAEVLLDIAGRLKRMPKEELEAIANHGGRKKVFIINLALRLDKQTAEYKNKAVKEKWEMNVIAQDLMGIVKKRF